MFKVVFYKWSGDSDKNISDLESAVNIISYILAKKYPEVDAIGSTRRILGRLKNKMFKALDAKAEGIDFTLPELEIIKQALEQPLPYNFSGYLVELEDAIQTAIAEVSPVEKIV